MVFLFYFYFYLLIPHQLLLNSHPAEVGGGESINRNLMTGPVREEHVPIMADIEAMFYQGKAAEKHRNSCNSCGGTTVASIKV